MTDWPLHIFSIVVNGEPFVRWHLDQFKKLPFRWEWHLIEGVADLRGCTAWSVPNGGRAPFLRRGLSNDGTSEYLNSIQGVHGNGRVGVTRKCCGKIWDGKLEMVQEPLKSINESCLLLQCDIDELWTCEQLVKMRQLFIENPQASAALYRCHYFVGPDLVVTSLETYGNHDGEWRRTWRYKPGDRWRRHEPPVLRRPRVCEDLALLTPISYDKTVPAGLTFQHFAYATEAQIIFKRDYYGYKNAVDGWRRLQANTGFPCKLRDFFDWVKDETVVDRCSSVGIEPLINLHK